MCVSMRAYGLLCLCHMVIYSCAHPLSFSLRGMLFVQQFWQYTLTIKCLAWYLTSSLSPQKSSFKRDLLTSVHPSKFNASNNWQLGVPYQIDTVSIYQNIHTSRRYWPFLWSFHSLNKRVKSATFTMSNAALTSKLAIAT